MISPFVFATALTGILSSSAIASAAAHSVLPSPTLPSAPNSPSTLTNQGKAFYDAGQFAEAVKVLQQAAQAYQSQGNTLNQAATLSNLSLAYQQLGAWQEAKQAIDESLTLLTERDPKLFAQALDIQGRLQLSTGQAELALATWQRATKLHTKAGNRAGEIRSRLNQSRALQAMGFYRRSLEELTDLNKTLQPQPDSLVKAAGLRSLGDALQLADDLDQSRQALEQSLVISRKLHSPDEESATLFSLGNTVRIQQQPEAALSYYQQAANLSPSAVLQTQARLNWLSLLIETNQRKKAEILLPSVWQQVEAFPPSRPAIYARINLVQSVMKIKTLNSLPIAQLLATAVQQAQTLGDRRAESFALGSLGKVYEQNRQWADAQQLTEQALLLSQTINASDISYRWQWQMGRLLKQQGNIPRATAAYEAAVTTLQSLRSDLVAVNRDVQFTFRDSVEPVYRQTVELLLLPPSQGGEPSAQNLDKARRLIESLQLAELDNFFREACLNAQSVLLDQVVDRDNPTAAIVYPIILENQLAVIVKVPHQPLRYHAVNLPRTEVERVLAQLQQAIREPDAAKEVRSLSQQVYRWLIQPVEADLKQNQVNTLVFVQDGLLRNIPMAVLSDGNQYLIEKYAIALSPGLQLFTPQPLAQTRLNALTAGLSQPPAPFSPLPEVKSELDLIKQAGISTTELLDQGFTSRTLEQQINALPFKVVHLATHGQFSSEAKNTYILAADGRINVSQLDSLLRSRSQTPGEAIELLVLSACQTAAGDNRATLGLAGVAVRAGARSTLASLWHIDDRSTALFIGEFYRELATAKVTKAEALRRAQVSLLRQPNYSRPSYWAPYVLVGNWL